MASPPAQRILYGAALAFLGFLGCERVNVTAVDVATVEVSPTSLALPPGGSDQLTARVLDENGDELMGRNVTWSSADGAVVTVSNDGEVTAVGNGSTTVRATAGGVSGEATVSVNVTGSLQLSTSEVQFQTQQGGSVSAQNVQVTNGGTGTLTNLDYQVEYDGSEAPWLAPSLNQSTTPATLTIGTNAGAVSSLGPGIYTARLVVTAANASNSPLELPVQLTISTPSPAIGLNPPSPSPFVIQEGAGPGDGGNKTVSVTNVGGGSLTGLNVGSISYGSGGNNWLNASLSSGSAPATLTLSLRNAVSNLDVGVYTATVPITSGAASNSPQNVSVTLTVGEPPPQISLTGTPVTFETVENVNPEDQSVGVTNPGGGTLNQLTVSEGVPWLSASLDETTAPTDVVLSVDVTGLAPNTYNAAVQVRSPVATNTPQTFNVELTVLPGPEIVLGETEVTFEGQAMGALPGFQEVTITNGGNGTLSGLDAQVTGYSGGATGWLNPTITGGPDAPANLRLTPTSLPAEGTHTATVEVTSDAPGVAPATVDVTFEVSGAASIGLSTATVGFSTTQGSSPPNEPVNVTNDGDPEAELTGLDWGATYGGGASGWLSTSSFNQTEVNAVLTLRVMSGSLAPGNYTATVTVSSPVAADDEEIAVTLQVAAQPSMDVDPTSVTFDAVTAGGSNPPNEEVDITNDGGGTLNGLGASETASWLSVSLSSTTAPATLTLTADIGGLSAGTHNTDVTISGNGVSDETVPVSITVNPGPSMDLDPTSVTFDAATAGGSNPPNEEVDITNGGGGTLNGLGASEAVGWLSVSLSSTTAPATLTLSADITGLTAGTYNTNVTISGNGVSDETVPVSMTVNPGASMDLNPTSVTFDNAAAGGANPPDETVDVTNTGGGTLSGLDADESVGWLSLSLSSQTAPATLTLSADISTLSAGDHSTNVTVSGNGVSDETLPVSITINAPAASMSLEPGAVSFDDAIAGGANPPDEDVDIENVGGGALTDLDASEGADWLSVGLSSTTAPATLTLSADIGGLAAGPYNTDVTVSADGVPDQTLPVSLTVNAPAAVIAVEQASVTFDDATAGGANPPDEELEITNGGGGALEDLDASDDADWLTTSLSATSAPSTLTLSADIAGLAAETHQVTVTITSASADDANVTVSLTVNPAAVLMVTEATKPGAWTARSASWWGHHASGVAEHGFNVSVTADHADTNAGDHETSASVVVS